MSGKIFLTCYIFRFLKRPLEEYKKYREERIETEGVFESLEEWRIRMISKNGEEKKEEYNAS